MEAFRFSYSTRRALKPVSLSWLFIKSPAIKNMDNCVKFELKALTSKFLYKVADNTFGMTDLAHDVSSILKFPAYEDTQRFSPQKKILILLTGFLLF